MTFQDELGRKRITITPDCLLRTKKGYYRLACSAAKIVRCLGCSRREFADWIAETIFNYEGQVYWPDGRPFVVKDTLIDDAFNDDGSFRWMSELLRLTEVMPKQRPQRRIIPRLRAIDLALQIAALEQRDLAA